MAVHQPEREVLDRIGAEIVEAPDPPTVAGGDVNGDSFADVVIGCSKCDNVTGQAGKAFIFLGAPNMDTTVGKTLLGPDNVADDEFGNAVATGDMNNDGFADVAVGCRLCQNGGTSDAGKVVVFFGAAAMDTTVDNTFADPDDIDNDEFGRSVVLTDINRDGFAEVVAGCHRCDNTANDSGKFFVLAIARTRDFNIFHIKAAHDNNTDEISITWKGRSTSGSPLHLEVFRHGSFNAWENRVTDSTAAAGSDVTLTDAITTNLSDYYQPGDNIVRARVFQGPANQVLETDLLEIVLGVEAPATIIGDGTDPGSVTVAPGEVTALDAFTLATNTGLATVTEITTTLALGTFNGLSLLEITSDDGATVYGSSTPTSDVVSVSVNILVNTDPTQFKIRITPKTHLAMPAVPGTEFAVTGTVTSFVSTNPQGGSDFASATVTIDNLSPNDVTNAATTAGDQQITVSWSASISSDVSNYLVLRKAATSVTEVPVEGSSPGINDSVGSGIVRHNTASTTFTDTGLTNGIEYFYKIFTKDMHSNYSTPGFEVSGTSGRIGTGTIHGRVTDAVTGRALRDVVVQIETGQEVTTKGNGTYTLNDVPAGEHAVTASKTGYLVGEEPVTLSAEETFVLDLVLIPE